jgi:hypothetical protein
MKKITLFSSLLLFVIAIFSSCSTTDTVLSGPTIKFQNSITSFEIDYATQADPYTVTIIAGIDAVSKIKDFTVKEKDATGASIPITVTGSFSGETSFTETFNISCASTAAFPLQIIFTVTDKLDKSMEKIFTITKKASGAAITTLEGKILGGADNTTVGSFIHLGDGSVMNTMQAGSNQGAVDLIFTYSSTNGNLMAAPNDGTIDQAFTTVTAWTTKNATKFTALLTAVNFDNVTNDLLITSNVTTAAAANTRINSLAVGSVFGFITAANKKGLIKVTAIGGTVPSDRSITFSIKIQQ